MKRRTGFLYNRQNEKVCNVLPLRENMYQIVAVKESDEIHTCGMTEEEFVRFKKLNNLCWIDELKQPTLFDIMAEECI